MQRDKVLHFSLSLLLQTFLYAVLKLGLPHLRPPPSPPAQLHLSYTLSSLGTLGLGALKELLDYYSIGVVRPCPCNAEAADFAADAAGWAVALAGACCFERCRRTIRRRAKRDEGEEGFEVGGGGGVAEDVV
mmetsp:Transcript_18800/g.37687  ORF Transcript_18800/g.37687 Transcript_18800/m.37687 type:complete len:132 (+) Transcript_18800:96-491(+)|eukprot:CAMPEP_0182478450 /NCGR_PEP_ID=MMETSP1319-20130603/32521_1 /TAXON_ID=172717 /ORGANISM="Bolidomonas pacifica, Strain RCC208" /LENGTH=131 /DNA_ID=CAMNT_0024679791 /DNA_START=47 /DNA_END=442 /DNA_ORIENTATION=+